MDMGSIVEKQNIGSLGWTYSSWPTNTVQKLQEATLIVGNKKGQALEHEEGICMEL